MVNSSIKKVIIFFLLIIILLINSVCAYYYYENRFTIFKLNRNIIPANFNIFYDKTTPTNQDVEMKITFDKPVSIIGDNYGIEILEDKKTLKKVFSLNENNSILVRDEDFNYQEISYNLDWIDKEPPIIIGADNKKTYNNNVHLDYTDNFTISEIYSDYYSDNFTIYEDSQDFYETNNMQIVPATKDSITLYVLSNTKEMEKYNYYLDGILYESTHEKKYTFTNLELSDKEHNLAVEALDREGNIIERKEINRKTVPIRGVDFDFSQGVKYIALKGTPKTLTKLSACAWVEDHYEDTLVNLTPNNDSPNSYVISLAMWRHKNYIGRYIVKFEFEYKENNIDKKATLIGSVYMPNNYKASNYLGLPYDFIENGNYYVRCRDEAGNESEINFQIDRI